MRHVYDEEVMNDHDFNRAFDVITYVTPFVYAGVSKRIKAKSGTVLDIGSGTDALGRMLVDKGFNVFSVDMSRDMMSFGDARCKHVQADALRLPFRDGQFDVVVSNWTLHHIADVPGFFEELNRVCKAAGEIIIADFKHSNVQEILKSIPAVVSLTKIKMLNDLVGTIISLVPLKLVRDSIAEKKLDWEIERRLFTVYIKKVHA
jgi:ubiquinone/menaquinone biosynthesis C-methylase UbiE